MKNLFYLFFLRPLIINAQTDIYKHVYLTHCGNDFTFLINTMSDQPYFKLRYFEDGNEYTSAFEFSESVHEDKTTVIYYKPTDPILIPIVFGQPEPKKGDTYKVANPVWVTTYDSNTYKESGTCILVFGSTIKVLGKLDRETLLCTNHSTKEAGTRCNNGDLFSIPVEEVASWKGEYERKVRYQQSQQNKIRSILSDQ